MIGVKFEYPYETLPDEWLIRAYKEIYKNMSLDKEYIKKIDSLQHVYHNDIKFQCIVVITSTNKYFKIYPDKLIFRPKYQMYKKEKVLLSNNLNFIFNNFCH